MKFWWFLHTIWPSSLEACSPRSVLRSVFFLASNQCNTASSTGSSLWAVAQLVTCISTRTCLAATHTSFLCYGHIQPLQGHLLLPSGWCPGVTPSRTDHTSSRLRQVVIWLSTSATVLSHPFWYSNWKLNFARAPTHQWPVASKLGVVII